MALGSGRSLGTPLRRARKSLRAAWGPSTAVSGCADSRVRHEGSGDGSTCGASGAPLSLQHHLLGAKILLTRRLGTNNSHTHEYTHACTAWMNHTHEYTNARTAWMKHTNTQIHECTHSMDESHTRIHECTHSMDESHKHTNT